MRRRTFFGIVGAGAVGAAVLPGMLPGVGLSARARTETARAAVPTLDFLLAPLAGRSLPGGFRVANVSDIDRGSAQITLTRQDGAQVRVQVFRRSLRSTGLATTRLLDLRWMNGGDGEHVTQETAGLAIMNVAARLRRIEASAVRGGLSAPQRAALASLYTHERRTAIHGGFASSTPPAALETA
jgi:hypothetical protein